MLKQVFTHHKKQSFGFTLIELSIVLVIIGLLIGGVIVGRDLIAAAEIRAQISQIEKYNTAVKTFQLKYNGLPGDLPDPAASMFGFVARGTHTGQGDNNGFLAGNYCNGDGCDQGNYQNSGENVVFWRDLTTANLINGGFNTASIISCSATITAIDNYLPTAKLGKGNYVYVWSQKPSYNSNFFSISSVTVIGNAGLGCSVGSTNPGLTVQQAYNIDAKIDDGLPQTGVVTAQYLNENINEGGVIWASSGGNTSSTAYTTATPTSDTTCFDNGNITGAVQKYSTGTNSGNGVNCALSFKMQ